MTTDTQNIKTVNDSECKKAWEALWKLANNEISWSDGTIDFNSFYSEGKKLFDIKLKDKIR